MKILYGSQNFGYDNPSSDKDYIEFVYPTIDDIVNNRITNHEKRNEDGSITKVKDIRLLPVMILKQNFNDLQILYSKDIEDCDDLKWFFDNRERLVRLDQMKMFLTNKGYINSCLRDSEYEFNSNKNIARAQAFVDLIEQALGTDEMKFCNTELRCVRDSKKMLCLGESHIKNRLMKLERMVRFNTNKDLKEEMMKEITCLVWKDLVRQKENV